MPDPGGEVYALTPFGLLADELAIRLGLAHGACDTAVRSALDALELHMRRHYAKGGNAAIILQDDGSMVFATVHRAPTRDRKAG
ncbi:MAG TPA: hypothetical protein VNK48_14565 [Xanthobacteraceae bacterium]|nr:hypothetical protein [Xanthobacteraceae bacterium]